jgi:hypothetical protein
MLVLMMLLSWQEKHLAKGERGREHLQTRLKSACPRKESASGLFSE